jgi:hypothetical protein
MICPPKEIRKFDYYCGYKFWETADAFAAASDIWSPDYGATKLYVMTPETFTGWPESFVGLTLHRERPQPRQREAKDGR